MPIPLKQATAGQVITLGQFVDAADGGTTEDGLTIANTDIKLHKWGGTAFTNKNSGGATFIANGVYYATLDATDTVTAGAMPIFCTMAGARPIRLDTVVLPANVWDSLYGGTDLLQVDVDQVDGSGTAATRQSQMLQYAINSSVVAGAPAPTTTSFAGGLTGASYPDNCFRNAAIVFTSGVNAGLTPRTVTAFTSSSGLFTVTALPFSPSNGDTFLIVGVCV